jgi:hypothetical protein
MPVEQREQVTHVGMELTETGGTPCLDGRRQPSLGGTSRMSREAHVRICGGLEVKFLRPTRHFIYMHYLLVLNRHKSAPYR